MKSALKKTAVNGGFFVGLVVIVSSRLLTKVVAIVILRLFSFVYVVLIFSPVFLSLVDGFGGGVSLHVFVFSVFF